MVEYGGAPVIESMHIGHLKMRMPLGSSIDCDRSKFGKLDGGGGEGWRRFRRLGVVEVGEQRLIVAVIRGSGRTSGSSSMSIISSLLSTIRDACIGLGNDNGDE